MKPQRLGILGGGQLGRMVLYEAYRLGVSVTVLDPSETAACAGICSEFVCGDLLDFETVYRFGQACDVVTIEFENVNTEALRRLKSEGVCVYPDPDLIAMVQDKGAQKQFLRDHGFPTLPFVLLDNPDSFMSHPELVPGVLKLRRAGYDGKGVMSVNAVTSPGALFSEPCILEPKAQIAQELAVMVARNVTGAVAVFDPVVMDMHPGTHMLDVLVAPGDVSDTLRDGIVELARSVADTLQLVGVLAIELFYTDSGDLLINELSPRPHNSMHHTIEACFTSQFEQHLRAVLGWPLGDSSLRSCAGMVNLVGPSSEAHQSQFWECIPALLALPNVYVHHYGKNEVRAGRKLGHVTVLGRDVEDVRSRLKLVKERVL